MKFILVVILLITLFAGGIYVFMIPTEEQWVEDSYIYGQSFCNTYDGRCVTTSGHATMEKMTLFEKWKYDRWVNDALVSGEEQ